MKEKQEQKVFSCPECDTLLSVPADTKYSKGRCPHCRTWIDIPANAKTLPAEP